MSETNLWKGSFVYSSIIYWEKRFATAYLDYSKNIELKMKLPQIQMGLLRPHKNVGCMMSEL